MDSRPIGVFDSGIGGLNVLKACVKQLPHESFIYLADKANMPYGTRSRDEIRAAARTCADVLIGMNCKAVVIACNTATETAIEYIRETYNGVIFIGLEPAVKPCFRELGRNGYGVALVTEATARSAKFNRLIEGCEGRIVVAPQPRLAKLIEDGADEDVMRGYVDGMLAPYKDAEAVALGCSHYSNISGLISDYYGGNIKIYDGAFGAAARLAYCLAVAGKITESEEQGSVRFYSTEKSNNQKAP
ncbi:MAG: glutamate racemase [Clostridiales bacterium]|nr:glutamate racemase [Clostridiales bacterium]